MAANAQLLPCGDSVVPELKSLIKSLTPNGSGRATLYCSHNTAICGWSLDIQVAPDSNSFSAVDVDPQNPGNFLSGTAIRQE